MATGTANLAMDPCEAHYAHHSKAKIQAKTVKEAEDPEELDYDTFQGGIWGFWTPMRSPWLPLEGESQTTQLSPLS